jgi:hypothetical protein
MTFSFWKQTGSIKPFESIEEWEQFEQDCCKLPSLDPFINSPLKKSKVKKGIANGEKYDSFAEYTLKTYFTKVKGWVVERNYLLKLPYVDSTGKTRNYIPDFVVNGVFYECKGRFTALDELKKAAHSEVIWIFQEEINRMKAKLDELFPSWKDDFFQTN